MFRALGPYGHSQLLVYDFMQTRSFRPHCHTGNRRFHTVSRRSVTACLAAAISSVLLVSLSGCTMPRYAGRAESEQTLSDCERSYDAARHNHDIGSDAGQPLIVRYMASISARSQWIEVAATCIDRFGEGVLRAAQHTAISYDIARRFAGTGDAGTGSDTASDSGTADDIAQNMTGIHDASSLADVNELDILPEMLTGMALAEDRAGFTVEILAARGSSDATISLADEHKATGERLISLASGSGSSVNDPRRKIYEVGTLLANVNEIVDPATGLRASTFAVAEITCAREEIAAVTSRINDGATGGNAAGATSDSDTDGDTAEAPAGSTTGGSHTVDSSTDGSTTDDSTAEPTDRSSTESTDKADHTQSMRILANLVSSRVTSAFTAGYPSFDHALFVS